MLHRNLLLYLAAALSLQCCACIAVGSGGSVTCGFSLNGATVDLSALQSQVFAIKVGPATYHVGMCGSNSCYASPALSPLACQDYLGPRYLAAWPPSGSPTAGFSLIDPSNLYGGIRVDFANGQVCGSGLSPTKTRVNLFCGPPAPQPLALSPPSTDPLGCAFEFNVTTPAACGQVAAVSIQCPSTAVLYQQSFCYIVAYDINMYPIKTNLIGVNTVSIIQGNFSLVYFDTQFGSTFKLFFTPVSSTAQFGVSLPGTLPATSAVIKVLPSASTSPDPTGPASSIPPKEVAVESQEVSEDGPEGRRG